MKKIKAFNLHKKCRNGDKFALRWLNMMLKAGNNRLMIIQYVIFT